MFTNRLALAILGGACVIAAGTGAFVATRQPVSPAPPAVTSVAPRVSSAGAAAPATAVQETEAAIPDVANPAASHAPSAQAPAPPAKPAAERPAARRPAPTTPAGAARPAPRRTAPVAPREDTSPARSASAQPASTPQPRPVDRPSPPASARTELPPIERVDPLGPDDTTHAASSAPVREPERQFDELIVPSDSVIGLQLESSVSTESAHVEDRVDARVTRDVTVDGRVAIPAGSRVRGEVTLVDRGGKLKDRARLGVRFHTLVLADGTTMPIQTDTVYRDGESPAQSSAAKIGGGAIGGAIVGAILGGARGAVIGGSTGAAGGTAAVMAGGRRAATLSAGSTVTVRVLSPVTVTVDN
jgi:type IV secretory pathway VirB10-like protein